MRIITLVAFVLGLLVASAIPYTFAATPSIPSGVSSLKWIAISPTAGFVITDEGSSKMGGLSGYFMAVHSGKWVRLDALNSAQVFGAH